MAEKSQETSKLRLRTHNIAPMMDCAAVREAACGVSLREEQVPNLQRRRPGYDDHNRREDE